MLKKRRLSSFGSEYASSLFKKRLAAFFIFACMAVNGFVPNNMEVNKHSFIMLFANISQNAAVQLLNKCGNSLMAVTSKICTDISGMMLPSADDKQPVNNQKSSNKEDRSNDYAVVINSISGISKRVNLSDGESKIWQMPAAAYADIAFKKYSGYTAKAESPPGLLILFLIFVTAIRMRKGIAEGIAARVKETINKKIRISA
ncbi:MAG: hypothetical protein FWG57_00075 [Endomicrobia bacterium]|nr:hypothetical protein [Endomicrobiia bacterium]